MVSAAIIRAAIAPRFGEQRYAAGLEAGVDGVFARIGGGAPPKPAPRRAQPALSPAAIALLGLIFGVFVMAVVVAVRHPPGGGPTLARPGGGSPPPLLWGRGGGGGALGGGGGGGRGCGGGGSGS